MLLDVTAVLSTSSTLNAVAEAFAVPASSRLSIIAPAAPTVDQAAWARATDPQLVPQDDPHDTRTLEQLVALVPFEVADWWATADEATRLNLVTSAPQVVGNLEGVPYTVRDAANRDYLGQTVASLQSRIADGSVGRAATAQLQAQLHMLQQVQDAIQTSDTDLPRTLVNLDIADGGRAVIAIGDLATADYISYLIPGMFYSVDSEIGSWTDAADLLAADQAEWLTRLTPAQHIGEIQTVATVAWIGYQAPTVVNVASLDLAREGRDALTESLRGLDAVRSAATAAGPASPAAAAVGPATTTGVAPYVSVLAHSYGATAALLALQQNDVTVDALAMVGSPGSPAENVGQLRVRDGNVWVADATLDPVASTGAFGSQPLSDSYGAHHFGVEGAVDPLTGRELAGSVGHVDYFTAGSESFRNMALIGIGRGGYVLDPDGATSAAPRALAG